MKKNIALLFVLIPFLAATSCKTDEPVVVKKPEKVFRSYQGRAKIVSIEPAKEDNGRVSSSYMDVFFDFIATDPGAEKKYLYPESGDKRRILHYDNRDSFHQNWIMKWGIKTGKEYPAVRYESGGNTTGAHIYYNVELKPEQ